ncbi:MAG: helix-turn-helix domain-containing protein [Pseudomonadales bacterium]|nr:helix-turn-helix domain-containing protein [Pseudomonadales bacterium]
MNPNRLHRARKAKGLSTRALASAAGVSAMAISKYERGVTRPSPTVLDKLLAELDIDRDFLEKTEDIHLEDIEYRTLYELGLSPAQEKRILADVTSQLEVRLECERLIPGLRPGEPKLPALPKTIGDDDDIEAVAEAVREAWQLADLPIKNLLQTVEQHGFRVFSTEVDKGDRFDGFSAIHDDMPIIVLGTGWSGDRQRFTLAHELGHHLMKGRLAPALDDETACHRFAGALLVPKARVIATLGWHRQSILPYELYILKHEWGLSMQAWVHRAHQAGVISERAMKAQWTVFRRNKWFRQEPLEQYPIEQPFGQYTAIAQELQKGRIDPGMAAKLMKVPREHLVGLLNLGG